jgi:hypothetical protein
VKEKYSFVGDFGTFGWCRKVDGGGLFYINKLWVLL